MSDDTPTPALRPVRPPSSPPPRTWPDVVLQLGQTAAAAGAALLLARWGYVSGKEALAALVVAHLPAALRLGSRLRPPTPPPPAS